MSFVFGAIYFFFMIFFWNQATGYFEVGENGHGWWNLFISAANGAALGATIL